MVPTTETPTDRVTDRGTRRVLAAALVAVGVALFAARALPRFRDPALFAEDGEIFLAGAYNDGLAALVEPYAGYLHLVPRLVAAATVWVPITAVPLVYLVATVVIHLAFLAPALSRRLDPVLPSALYRSGLFVSLCLLPALWEVYGNIANLIFAAATALTLVLISVDPRTRPGRWIEIVAIGLIGLSGPLIVLFVPFFVWRWLRLGRTRHSLAVTIVAVATAAVQLSVYLSSDRSTPGGGTVTILVRSAVERVGGGYLVGHRAGFVGALGSPTAVAAALWLTAAVVLTCWAVGRIAVPLWLLFVVLLASAVNAYGPIVLASGEALQRHITTPMAIVVILMWVTIASRAPTAVRVVAAGLLLCGALGAVRDFAPEPYPFRPDLRPLERCVEADAGVCRQLIFGPGWEVVLAPDGPRLVGGTPTDG